MSIHNPQLKKILEGKDVPEDGRNNELPVSSLDLEGDENAPVMLTGRQLRGILDKLSFLEGQQVGKPKRATERTARMRIVGGNPVIRYGRVFEKFVVERNENVSYLDVYTSKEGEPESKHVVEYLPFLNEDNQTMVLIKSQKAKELVQDLGSVSAENPNPHFDKKFRSHEVELEVRSYEYEAVVEFLDGDLKGQFLTVSTEALNR